MADMSIKVDYGALDTGVFLLNATVEYLRFSSSRCDFSTVSKGRLMDSDIKCMDELESAEDAFAELVQRVADSLANAGVSLQQSEQQIINAINRLGLYSEFEAPAPSEPSAPASSSTVDPNFVPNYTG